MYVHWKYSHIPSPKMKRYVTKIMHKCDRVQNHSLLGLTTPFVAVGKTNLSAFCLPKNTCFVLETNGLQFLGVESPHGRNCFSQLHVFLSNYW